uniref:Tetratricopeptide repeat protein n=1 Tax=Desulfobacca acetoxidans TaxID=60893 RepID=A0A7C3SJ20_9BACT
MARKLRWLASAAPLLFLGLLLWLAYGQNPDFWRSPASLFKSAQEAEERGELVQARRLAETAWSMDPSSSDCGTFLGWLYLKGGEAEKSLEILQQVWARDNAAVAALKGQAWALEKLGRRPEALTLLADFLSREPNNHEVLQTAAEIAGQRPEDYGLAVGYYQRLYELKPDPQVRRVLVDLLTSLNRFREAIPLQEEAAAQSPQDQEALHRLALLHYWQRDYQAAGELYRQLLEKAADNATFRQEAAQVADAAQNPDEAIKHYLWLYGRHRGKKEYALKLARLWSQKGNHAEAAAVLGPLLAENPQPDIQRWYALEVLLTGDFDQALKGYRAAWEAGDTHRETIINLARLYGQKQQFTKAAAMWDEAARRQLIHGELRWEAALAYSYARRYEDAITLLKPVERDNPKYPRIQTFLGQMHFYQKHWGQAAHYFRAYLEKHPEDLEVRRLLAEALAFGTETKGEAISEYGELLKRADDPNLRLRRAALLLEAQRWEEAREDLQKCPAPAEPRLVKELARLYLWLGDLEEALRRYEDYLVKVPRDREAILEKARVLTFLGRSREAREILKALGGYGTAQNPLSRESRALLAAAIEAALAGKDWQEAEHLALRLFSAQFPDKGRPARDWREASRWREEERGKRTADGGKHKKNRTSPQNEGEITGEDLSVLTLEERTWVARALVHSTDPSCLNLAADLLTDNLWQDRHHHPSLILLGALLPRLPRYEDLSRLVYRIPGIKVDGPEYVATLAFFTGKLGRQGGKLDYLLHLLTEYRHHKTPKNPGQLLALADLAQEVGDKKSAEEYYRLALKIKPNETRISQLLLNCQLSHKDWGKAVDTLNQRGLNRENALDLARIYLARGQYEGVKAAVAQIPENHPDRPQGLLLLAQVCRLERNFPEALKALEQGRGRLDPETLLMEQAQVLEAMGDKTAAGLYREIIKNYPDSQIARVAEARRARAAGNWAGAYKAYAKALEYAPQDIQLLNELEYVRQQLRPQVASRGFPHPYGERRPEESVAPWQFSRPDREFLGRLPAGQGVPIFQPESLYFEDHNGLYGTIFRASGGFRLTRNIPLHLAVEYREYNQNKSAHCFRRISPTIMETEDDTESRWRRAELALGFGPIYLKDSISLSGEIIGRRYWKRVDHHKTYTLVIDPGFPEKNTPPQKFTEKEQQNKLFGSLQLSFPITMKTSGSIKYGRRDIFDQDEALYPRLYQSVTNLAEVKPISVQQVEFNINHQFRPGLEWRSNIGGAFFSDGNRRLSLYQGLLWQVVHQPRMHLGITPHYYLAAYRDQKSAYFSPSYYHALGVGVDFDRQVFRLPTLILQGAVQAVGQHGDWGPALHGLAALEWEMIHNFFVDPHVFYFREWVDNYRILTFGLSMRYTF